MRPGSCPSRSRCVSPCHRPSYGSYSPTRSNRCDGTGQRMYRTSPGFTALSCPPAAHHAATPGPRSPRSPSLCPPALSVVQEILTLMRFFDKNNDGQISWREFIDMVPHRHPYGSRLQGVMMTHHLDVGLSVGVAGPTFPAGMNWAGSRPIPGSCARPWGVSMPGDVPKRLEKLRSGWVCG